MTDDVPSKDIGEPRPAPVDKTPDRYLEMLKPELRASFTEEQLDAIKALLKVAIPRSAPKLVDLRFQVDLFAYRFYVVLFIGKDRRDRDRGDAVDPAAQRGSAIAALLMLIGFNLIVSLIVLLLAFSIKLLIDVSLFPNGH